MPKGFLCLVLHAHLPFVRHPEEEYFLEENWLYEAITETYIPIINICENLLKDRIFFRFTMSLTPPLIEMLQDPLLQDRYIRHLDKLIELSEKEIYRTQFEPHYHQLANNYHKQFKDYKDLFVHKYHKNIIEAFKSFQEKGCLEIITCSATHGFLPLLNINPSSVKAQLNIGIDHYKKTFQRKPEGIWLPECGYEYQIDEHLKNKGIRYFFVDTHGIIHANPTPEYGVYTPIYCPSGVAAFGRDTESSKQVWSAHEGYPGDVDYREYYRDIGHDLDYEYIKPYIHPDGIRINTGIKYWRITGRTDYKEVYRPEWASEKAAQHAGNFMFNREKQIEHLANHMKRVPIIVSPYDAELFGHWWHEGPLWLDYFMRKAGQNQDIMRLITPSEYLRKYPIQQMSTPSPSSWGYKGYNEFWLDKVNSWVYRHVHMAGKRMNEIANTFAKNICGKNNSRLKRALNQAARELLLAEASDWTFIMKAGTMVPYAEKRIKQHIGRFNKLYNDIINKNIDPQWLSLIEEHDNIFKDINCAQYYIDEEIFNDAKKTQPQQNKITIKNGSNRNTAVNDEEALDGHH
ncbi:MAG: DUF1957 domain-containing protein [Candidatus Omnitrophica bacterium]|nr:DUF1957 domain-containing protein [Candidatus Omnitrophota bacterium]